MKETGASTSLVLRQPPPPPAGIPFFEAGGQTFHRHTCPVTNHEWDCNSPYCATLTEPCPDHGGHEPTRLGQEPWRK